VYSPRRDAELKSLYKVFSELAWAWDPDLGWVGCGPTTLPFQLHVEPEGCPIVWRYVDNKWHPVARGEIADTFEAALPVVRAFYDELTR